MDDEKKNGETDKTNHRPANTGGNYRDSVNDDNLVFYYSRERRLSRASPAVRALNDTSPKSRGAFRGRTGSRSTVLLLVPVLMIVFAITMLSKSPDRGQDFWDNTITLKALKYQGATFLSINKKIKNADRAYVGEVDLAISPAEKNTKTEEINNGDESYLIVTERIIFSYEPEEEFRFSLPFEGEKLLVLMQSDRGLRQYTVIVD